MLTFELSYQIKKYGIYDKDFLKINTPYFYCKNETAKGKKQKRNARNANIFIKINPSFFFITYVLKLHHLVDCM